MTSLCSEDQHLSANQISSTYLNPRLRYNYFRFGKTTVRHIGIRYSACHSGLVCRILSKSGHPQRRYDVTSIFKMATAAAKFYFQFRIWWPGSLQNVCVYQQTKCYSYNSIYRWCITISDLKKNVRSVKIILPVLISTISPQSTCHSAPVLPNFIQSGLPTADKWQHVDFPDARSRPSWILGVQ